MGLKPLLLVAAVAAVFAAAAAVSFPRASSAAASGPFGPTVLHMHGNPTDDSGCTGAGAPDIIACDGPSLLPSAVLGAGPAGHWDVPEPAADGTADRNIYDPNWVWKLSGPTALEGAMTVNWWGSGGATGAAFTADWTIRLWADGAQVFEQTVTVTPDLPNVPKLLTATVSLPRVNASSNFVLQVDPVYIDVQANTHIYYDSQLPCPGATAGPCDSTVTMPVVDPASTPTPTPTPGPSTTPTPAPAGAARFTNYPSPPGYGDDWGEPSIGVNWKTGKIMSFGGFSPHALRVSFDDCPSPAVPNWEKSSLFLESQYRPLLDPILFTDRQTGRTFVSQLVGGSKQSTMEYTDDDGDTYSVSQGSGINSGYDHQTVGGGRFAPGGPLGPQSDYPNAVYYCSQDDAYANCALSLDGGRTFGPAVPMYTIADCGGIHGHVKVSPVDGTVYVPNGGCGGQSAVAVSTDDGITWAVRKIPGSSSGAWDPSVGVADDGTIYVGYDGADGHAYIARSTDKGANWTTPVDVGAQVGVKNIVFSTVVAGDGDRAAFAFIGTTAGGDYDADAFTGVWYVYVATTYNGGQTWTTVNATPGDPVQRGRICASGTFCAAPGGGGDTRNLLDFMDATLDREGRVIVGYADGCINECVQGGANSYTAKAAIVRQSGGRRMFAQYDPSEPAAPGSPALTATKDSSGSFVRLSWSKPDDGGSPVTSYNLYRRTDSGGYTLLASVPENYFEDHTINPSGSYFYKVTAVNAFGEGQACSEAQAGGSSRPNTCDAPGPLVVNDTKTSGADDDAAPNSPADARLNIRQLFVSQPYTAAGNRLVFKLQTAAAPGETAAPPSSQWFVIWNRTTPEPDYDRFYVAMKSDALGAVTYEYGKFGIPLDTLNPNPHANTPSRLGDADSGSYDPATGVITITLSLAKADGIRPGQHLAFVEARSFLGQPDGAMKSVRTASDITGSGDYVVIDNTTCKVNRPPTAELFATPLSGYAPLNVSFDASHSADADGDTIASYTFNFGDGSPEVTQASPAASHTFAAPGNYNTVLTVTDATGTRSTNVANAVIEVREPPQTTVVEDDDSRIAYSDGWHLGTGSGSANHFRYHTGTIPTDSAVLDFSVPQGKTGSITYYFARSAKGGTGQVYLDGVLAAEVNCQSPTGSLQSPEFSDDYKVSLDGLAAGAHRLEIRNMSDAVYVDRFVLVSGSSAAQPANGPGQTANQTDSATAGQTVLGRYQAPSNMTGLSVVVESSLNNVPFQLALVSPSGLTLKTAAASKGVAAVEMPVTQGGTYVVRVVNLSVGPLKFKTAITPTVRR